jgi:hypothetical protein
MKVLIYRLPADEAVEEIEARTIHVWQGRGQSCHIFPSENQVFIEINGNASSFATWADGAQIFLSEKTKYKVIRPLAAKGGAA